ncbi:putative iron permease [Mycena sanguinolenta]|uniref:Putative iron permease n=1 Tax=Mycena sanguinolenta TaxID=230812 RepID=A0A8H6XII4_9AGAR|nr:putative iron permease [Mycena sanguinolenta]
MHSSLNDSGQRRGSTFWLIFIANLVVDLLAALNFTAVSTAIPTIVGHLHGSDFIWVGSAYTVASTAILPTMGGLASTLGRKRILLGFIVLFALGSALCGSAQSLNMLIAVVQGIGGGGCISVTEIIYADLIPLPERGKFRLGVCLASHDVLTFMVSPTSSSSAIGPPIGGALSASSSWRWLFFLNIPLSTPPQEVFRSMIWTVDWVGLALLVAGTTTISIALAWAGFQHSWSSKQVLIPLCMGCSAIGAFSIFEYKFSVAKIPTIPSFLVTNRTTLSGYIGTGIHGIVSMAAIFYLPVYFQACKLASPIHSGVDLLGLVCVLPVLSILVGVSVQLLNQYRPQNYVGWVLTIVGFGLVSRLDKDSTMSAYIGFQVVLAIGLSILWISTQFAVLAPLPFSNNAHALAFFTFNWGIVFGGTILQNTLKGRLPSELLDIFGKNTQLAYWIIPQLTILPTELRDQVRDAFGEGLRIIWYSMLAISALGLLSCLLMEEVKMRNALDDTWGIAESPGARVRSSELGSTASEK